MCKEYGTDEDWVGLTPDDYDILQDDYNNSAIPDYKTFELHITGNTLPMEIARIMNETKENIFHTYDMSDVPDDFIAFIADKYEFMDTRLNEHIYSECLFKEGEDEYQEVFGNAPENIKVIASNIYDIMNANHCAYIRFIDK